MPAAEKLGAAPRDAHLFMIADKRWKLIHAVGFRPMLFDLATDPDELHDLGADAAHAGNANGYRRRWRNGDSGLAAYHPLGAADRQCAGQGGVPAS